MDFWLWLPLGLIAALGTAAADAVTKRFFTDLSPYGMALAYWLFALPYLLLVGLAITWPPLDRTFWLAVLLALPLEAAAALLYMRAIKVCPLSLCIPFLAFTPLFLIVTGQLILGEGLNGWGVAAVFLIAGGSYVLSLSTGRFGFLAPIRALLREAGARCMLAVAVLYSCTAALGKLAILHSEPAFYGVLYPLIFSVVMLAGYPLSNPRPARALLARRRWGLLLGLCMAAVILSQVYGLKMAPAAYLIAVKRTSVFFSVVLGGVWLKERPIAPRLVGAALMALGVLLIAFKGS
ncbi:MAG: DMT family transporter [Deltaproteobacteria bacterium]|nr:DMT family transporter [Deltaproteobacteria bacterium]